MSGRTPRLALLLIAGLGVTSLEAHAQLIIEWESGPTIYARSDIGVPGSEGTVYSAADDAGLMFAQRIGVGSTIGERHTVILSFAPYELQTEGQFTQPVAFLDSIFLPGLIVRSEYELNLYRLSYHYQVITTDRLGAAVGVAAQLRSARASLTEANVSLAKRVWGVRPLVSARLRWQFFALTSLRVDADAISGMPFCAKWTSLVVFHLHSYTVVSCEVLICSYCYCANMEGFLKAKANILT